MAVALWKSADDMMGDMRPGRASSRRLAIAAALAFVLMGLPLPANGSEIRVFMDHARVIKLDRPVSKVIVGNAGVADVAVSDPRTIILTGRSFGSTNLVILDAEGSPIVDERVLVTSDEAGTLRVYKQAERETYSCSPICQDATVQALPN
jgi:Flp pilus assembly secretin CpaC